MIKPKHGVGVGIVDSDPFSLRNLSYYQDFLDEAQNRGVQEDEIKLWAPELHYKNEKWLVVHTSNMGIGSLALSDSSPFRAPVKDWGSGVFKRRHDPNIFTDEDGTNWLIYAATKMIKLKSDLSGLEGEELSLPPSNRKIGHEGSQIIKFNNKYI